MVEPGEDAILAHLWGALNRLHPVRDLLEASLETSPLDRHLVSKLNEAILDIMEARAARVADFQKTAQREGGE